MHQFRLQRVFIFLLAIFTFMGLQDISKNNMLNLSVLKKSLQPEMFDLSGSGLAPNIVARIASTSKCLDNKISEFRTFRGLTWAIPVLYCVSILFCKDRFRVMFFNILLAILLIAAVTTSYSIYEYTPSLGNTSTCGIN